MNDALTVNLPCSLDDTVYIIQGKYEKQGRKKVYVEKVVSAQIDRFIIASNGLVADICTADNEWYVAMVFDKDYWTSKEDAEKHLGE